MKRMTRYILLVDDEQNILNALRRELQDWVEERSLEILTALSAQEGLEILKTHGSDTIIVVSDLKMPGIRGSDFLLEVKRTYPSIISILLTGFSETTEIIKAVRAGIFSFMLKPWDSDYLISEITKAYEYGEMLRQKTRYMETVTEELKWAGELQRTILKPNLPRSDALEFRVSYQPVPGLYCGGDYYDVIFIGANRYLLLIGDVAGHGVKAAFVTGILKAIIYPEYIRTAVGKELSPAAFLSWLNERMGFEFRSASNMIITFFAGVLDLGTSTFRYSNAGHNHPFIVREGKPTELFISGPAIGFSKSVSYEEETTDVRSGDIIDLYTDGLIETFAGGEPSVIDVGPILGRTAYGAEYHKRILQTVLAESGVKDFSDDVTILTAKLL